MKTTALDVNTRLQNIEASLESSILDDIQLLEMDRDQAIRELKTHSSRIGDSIDEIIEKLDHIADETLKSLKEVQKALGQLNYILAEEKIEAPEQVERFRNRLLKAFDDAGTRLVKLFRSLRFDEDWDSAMDSAQVQFLKRLELVRVHLSYDTETISREFNRIKRRVESDQQNIKSSDRNLFQYLGDFTKEMSSYVKAFFQDPDEGNRSDTWSKNK